MSTNHPAPLLPSQSPSPSPSLSLPSSRDFMTSLFNSLTSSSSRSSTSFSPIQISDRNVTSGSISYTRKFSKENERDDGDGNGNGNGNPLKQLDAQKKALLMTLHVIFPPPLLLHALDLLDRGGVGRVVLKGEGGIEEGISKREGRGDRRDGARGNMEQDVSSERKKEAESRRDLEVEDTEGGATTTKAHNPQATPSTFASPHKNYSPLAPVHPSPNCRSPPKTKPPILYQVRSSQPPKWHSSRSASGIGIGTGHASASASASSENTYTVHLDAWNCSCAAFAFSAFPAFPASSSSSSSTHPYPYISTSTSPSTSTSSPSYFPWSSKESSPDEDCSDSVEKEKEKRKEEEEKWQYGGWTKTSQVPICKHLLACLLMERWGDVLGMYVRERVVGREEMGGLVV
ncbi:uncharacterized protein EAE98_000468 [Botrytis deweyae]|uniref:SWIM-type domain-containing protein n=1 Tax=Botrytis deweyae TaxID=2478750 RepID=A0ABQ7J304_9HELO|nr:uncharacterized protein EAE98_000468 [Botrytis deweyae]KAF7940341.1 hypothetical protein EAE98_000468 [Botrytis deweyae]